MKILLTICLIRDCDGHRVHGAKLGAVMRTQANVEQLLHLIDIIIKKAHYTLLALKMSGIIIISGKITTGCPLK